jgi:hypothetical protein
MATLLEKEKMILTLYYGLGGEKRHTFAQVADELARAGDTTNNGNPWDRGRICQIVKRSLDKLGLKDIRSPDSCFDAAKDEHRLRVKNVGHVVKAGGGYRIEHTEIRDALEKLRREW